MLQAMINIVLFGLLIVLFFTWKRQQKRVRVLSHFVSGVGRGVELLFESTHGISRILDSERKTTGSHFLLAQIIWEFEHGFSYDQLRELIAEDKHLFDPRDGPDGGFPQLYAELRRSLILRLREDYQAK